MTTQRKVGILVAAFFWLVVAFGLFFAGKYWFMPRSKEKLITDTGTESQYKQVVKLAIDSFSGYCILRSDDVQRELLARNIKLELVDDNADYNSRAQALQKKDVQMAVFTIDSYLSACAKLKDFPATIVMVIDETKGGDGIVAYKDAVATLEDLNHSEARFVLTPNSPSEFLARIIIADLNMGNLPSVWKVEANGAQDVYRKFRSGTRSAKRAYVLWQPYISRALAEDGAHILFDSSKLSGYIVDVLVVERSFLRDHQELVREVMTAYFRAAHTYLNSPSNMVSLIREDARRSGAEHLSESQAAEVAKGIWFKNTSENYAHFGFLPSASHKLHYLEDMIDRIRYVLVKTGAVSPDSVKIQANQLFFQGVLRDLQKENFHPSRKLNIVGTTSSTTAAETIRGEEELPLLSDEQWSSLIAMGTMRVEPIEFRRGTASIDSGGERELEALASRMKSWPSYYLTVAGHTLSAGDIEENKKLAEARATAVLNYLVQAGVSKNRLKAKAEAGSGEQFVSFVLSQRPY